MIHLGVRHNEFDEFLIILLDDLPGKVNYGDSLKPLLPEHYSNILLFNPLPDDKF